MVARRWRRGDVGADCTVVARPCVLQLPAVSFHHLHAAFYKVVNPLVVAPAETETKEKGYIYNQREILLYMY